MSKLDTPSPEADFYEILQIRIDEITLRQTDGVFHAHDGAVINELKHMQQNFSSYLYRIKHKTQAD